MSIPEVDGQPVTREALVQGLQEDIAREYQAIIQYVIFSQKLDGARYQEIAQILEGHAHEELDHAIAVEAPGTSPLKAIDKLPGVPEDWLKNKQKPTSGKSAPGGF